MKRIAFFLSLLLAASLPSALAAGLQIPQNPVFVSPEDYKDFEPLVISSMQWLEGADLTTADPAEVGQIIAFIWQWVSGTPHVTVLVESLFTEPLLDSPFLLIVYMGGWSVYTLEKQGNGETIPEMDDPAYEQYLNGATVAALESVLKIYSQNREAGPVIPELDRWEKLHRKGKLSRWVSRTREKYAREMEKKVRRAE